MNRKLIDQWQKDFHEVVESLDIEKFKTFYRMYQDNVYGGRPMPKSDKVIMASMCKVALEITTISEATKKKADEWLGTEQEKYLRPDTLFGTKFESYLNQQISKSTQSNKQSSQLDRILESLRGETI